MIIILSLPLPGAVPSVSRLASSDHSLKLFSGGRIRSFGAKNKKLNFGIYPRCSVVSSAWPLEAHDQKTGPATIERQKIVEEDTGIKALEISSPQEIEKRVETIKSMLATMGDGEISVTAYDTAWVAMVEDVNGSGRPQFPSSIQWIAANQLADGSWGDSDIFSAHDRILSTLACVVALKTWNIHPLKCEKGLAYLRANMWKLEGEDPTHMPIGFEIIFPTLLEIARSLNIEFPYESPFLKDIYDQRSTKLTKIPLEVMHEVPTTLLHSLEGMTCLNWEKLIKLQSQDGSLLFSTSSTAYALAKTKDKNCLRYLENIVQRFKGGVPGVYPVDLFEHIWVVDRLERLGISRYFQREVEECLFYVNRYWTDKGICWARNSEVQDIDDTAMGFRLLRLHGYEVSAGAFQHFKKEDEFICFAGQSTQAVTGTYNLFRASQIQFPGEKILEEAKKFSFNYLKEKQAANQLLDKWIIAKDLAGEVGYALEVPWYANLPRVESRFYLEQYGGDDDVWIGKTLYRMPLVNNNKYLELAKMDYNNCQALHQMEWDYIQKWYKASDLGRFGMSKKSLLFYYFLAASSLFEQEKSTERIGWAQTAVLIKTIQSYFDNSEISGEEKLAFLREFKRRSSTQNERKLETVPDKKGEGLVAILLGTLSRLSLDAFTAHGQDIRQGLHDAWGNWLLRWSGDGDNSRNDEAELLVRTIIITSGYGLSEELFTHPQYEQLSALTNRICGQLSLYQKHKVEENGSCVTDMLDQINLEMQQLAEAVLRNSPDDLNAGIKQIFFAVAKTFYYAAYSDPATVNHHITKVLFERVK